MAAVDYFIKIDGIAGESQDAGHKGEIDVLTFSWGETRPGGQIGGGGGAGKISVQDFHFSAQTSKASPKLFLACATGEHIKKAVFIGRRAGQFQDFLTLTLSDVLVVAFQIGGSETADPSPVDEISLNFARIEFEYREQKPDGTLDTPVKAGWDVGQGRKI